VRDPGNGGTGEKRGNRGGSGSPVARLQKLGRAWFGVVGRRQL
jgi:hypothetical protein